MICLHPFSILPLCDGHLNTDKDTIPNLTDRNCTQVVIITASLRPSEPLFGLLEGDGS